MVWNFDYRCTLRCDSIELNGNHKRHSLVGYATRRLALQELRKQNLRRTRAARSQEDIRRHSPRRSLGRRIQIITTTKGCECIRSHMF